MPRVIAGYTYYSSKNDATKHISKPNDKVAFEGGLGWYVYNAKEYANNPLKRLFGIG